MLPLYFVYSLAYFGLAAAVLARLPRHAAPLDLLYAGLVILGFAWFTLALLLQPRRRAGRWLYAASGFGLIAGSLPLLLLPHVATALAGGLLAAAVALAITRLGTSRRRRS